MEAIWKFQIEVTGEQILSVPKGTKLIACQNQQETIQMWGIVNPDEKGTERRHIRMYTTGQHYEKIEGKYLTSVQLRGGNFVAHLFEVK